MGLIGFLSEYVQEQVESEPALQWDPSFIEEYLPVLDHVLRYFDADVEGFENLPAKGPMLLVGNHSGGTLVPDVAVFIAAWYRARRFDTPLMALAFDAVFGLPVVGKAARKAGGPPTLTTRATPSTPVLPCSSTREATTTRTVPGRIAIASTSTIEKAS